MSIINSCIENMLEIRNLKAKINDVEILHGVEFNIKEGEIHAIMGTNGLVKVLY